MKNLPLLFAFLLLFAASVSAQSKNERVAAEIRKVMDEQVSAWNRGDIDGFMQGYWNSDKLVFVSGDNLTYGWQPTLERYKKNYDSRAKMGVLAFSDLEIEVLSKDAALSRTISVG
jgi:hypothetical protein